MTPTTSQPARVARPARPRSRATVVAFVLLGLVQLFVSTAVPLLEGRASSGLGAHIEQPTERRHYVHDEAECSACIARHLTGTAPLPAPPLIVTATVAAAPRTTLLVAPDAERRGP